MKMSILGDAFKKYDAEKDYFKKLTWYITGDFSSRVDDIRKIYDPTQHDRDLTIDELCKVAHEASAYLKGSIKIDNLGSMLNGTAEDNFFKNIAEHWRQEFNVKITEDFLTLVLAQLKEMSHLTEKTFRAVINNPNRGDLSVALDLFYYKDKNNITAEMIDYVIAHESPYPAALSLMDGSKASSEILQTLKNPESKTLVPQVIFNKPVPMGEQKTVLFATKNSNQTSITSPEQQPHNANLNYTNIFMTNSWKR